MVINELLESELMKGGVTYDEAHVAALEQAGLSNVSLSHPEVIEKFPELFNNSWRAFLGH